MGFAANIGIRAALRNRSGSVMVETALVMPLLFTMALGTFEFGRALQNYHSIEKGLRDAARYLARVDVTCPTGAATGSVTDSADVTVARNLAMTGYPDGGTPILSYWTDPATVGFTVLCIDNTDGTLRGLSMLPVIRVSGTVPYADVGFLGALGLGPITFSVQHEEPGIGE